MKAGVARWVRCCPGRLRSMSRLARIVAHVISGSCSSTLQSLDSACPPNTHTHGNTTTAALKNTSAEAHAHATHALTHARARAQARAHGCAVATSLSVQRRAALALARAVEQLVNWCLLRLARCGLPVQKQYARTCVRAWSAPMSRHLGPKHYHDRL